MHRRKKSLSLSVVIPVYNEKENLRPLVERLTAVLRNRREKWEALLVDDGSNDGSFEEMLCLKKEISELRVIRLARNYGQHAAVLAGMERSQGNVVVTLDADLQNPPEEIPKLLEALQKSGMDIAAGWRKHRHDSWIRTLPSWMMNRLISRMTREPLHDYGCMLRAYRRKVVDWLLQCPEDSPYITVLTSFLTRRVIEVPIRHEPRGSGKSKYRFFSLFRFALSLILGFSHYPVLFMGTLGMSVVVLGVFFLAGFSWFERSFSPQAFLPLFSSVFLTLFGILFLLLSLLGEYLMRIYSEVQRRPRYIIDEIYD